MEWVAEWRGIRIAGLVTSIISNTCSISCPPLCKIGLALVLVKILTKTVLITGSRGLVGRRLCALLRRDGFSVKELDLLGCGESRGDVTHLDDIEAAIRHCNGVVHLGAVSRVVLGQRAPELCWRTNVEGVQISFRQR